MLYYLIRIGGRGNGAVFASTMISILGYFIDARTQASPSFNSMKFLNINHKDGCREGCGLFLHRRQTLWQSSRRSSLLGRL